MSSSLPATVNLSLMRLAEHGGFTGPHRDGWGIAYYEGPDVRLIKEAEAAAGSAWVAFVEAYHLRSPIVVAHVRRATVGERSYRNTQPFARELAGRMHLFAHNGWLSGIEKISRLKPRRFHPVGETDSEQAFCILLDRMAEVWKQPGEIPSLASRFSTISSFAQELRALGPANFLYSDGEVLFAHGHRRKRAEDGRVEPPGLVYLQRSCRKGEPGFTASGLSIELADQMVTLIASVPLTAEPWLPLGEGEVVAAYKGQFVLRLPAGADVSGQRGERS